MAEPAQPNPSSPKSQSPPLSQPTKKKRNLPGMPDPDAEVIALSPKTLLATNRFICEICNKGFQRDQNLQLHRRGHNLPWKLRQRTGKEIRKRVYVCPEPACVHHHPSRALGDLTGIKKHYCRKHGEKKFKCERCSKIYAVQSDWKAHMKTCGTREYRCDCGTLFSRRDSFITHRAFCDALAQETTVVRAPVTVMTISSPDLKSEAAEEAGSPPPQPPTPSTGVLSPVLSIQSSELPENQTANILSPLGSGALSTSVATVSTTPAATAVCHVTSSSTSTATFHENNGPFVTAYNAPPAIDPISLSLSSFYGPAPIFPVAPQNAQHTYATTTSQPALSATALLQKAAQMGATSSNSSFLRGLGLGLPNDNVPTTSSAPSLWSNNVKLENNSLAPGLRLGLPMGSGTSAFHELQMPPPATLDFLGLGMGNGEPSSRGFSAFYDSMEGGIQMGTAGSFGSTGETWDDSHDRKPSIL